MRVYWFDKLINYLESRLGQLAVPHLTAYIVAGNAFVFALSIAQPAYIERLSFNLERILSGELWRLATYVFIPPTSSLLFLVFALYFLWMIGSALEAQWGAFRFTLYYGLGMLGTTIIGCFFPSAGLTNAYLNTSLFLAFATLFPDVMVYLFFIIPVKVKYLAAVTGLLIGYNVLFAPLGDKLVALVSVLNYLLFFWPGIVENAKLMHRGVQPLPAFERATREPVHRCAVCNKTEKDGESLDFRTCDCGKEFCGEHLNSHTHG